MKEKNTENYISIFYNCKTKKELLLEFLPFKRGRANGMNVTMIIDFFNYCYDKLDVDRNTATRKEIEKQLFSLAVKKELTKETVKAVCDKYDLAYHNLIELLNKDSMNFDYPLKERINLSRLSSMIREIAIENQMTEETSRDFELAKLLLSMQVENNISTKEEFQASVNCIPTFYSKCFDILKSANHPICKQIEEIKRNTQKTYNERRTAISLEKHENKTKVTEEKIKSASKEELLEILKDPTSFEFFTFCRIHNLSQAVCLTIQHTDQTFIKDLIENIDDIENTYNKRVALAEKSIEEITSILQDKEALKDFDLYILYKKYGVSMQDLILLATNLNKTEELAVLGKYCSENQSKFMRLDEKQLNALYKNQIITCGEETLRFDVSTLYDAMKDIKENCYITYSGVVFGAIKARLNTKSNEQQKTKVIAN